MSYDPLDLETLIDDFRRSLTARNRAPRTIDDYTASARSLLEFLIRHRMPTDVTKITKADLEKYLAVLARRDVANRPGRRVSPRFVQKTHVNLRQLWNYLLEEDIVETSPFHRMKAPTAPPSTTKVMREEEVDALLAACKGRDFESRRDEAMIRLLLDTGLRVKELWHIEVDHLDFKTDTVTVVGKGNKPRVVPFGARVGEALRRYLRLRARHPKSCRTNRLWIGRQGPMTDHGIRRMLERREKQAGISHLHPHRFRHQFAHEWLAAGGGETDLMRLAGWSSRQMLNRYGASAADARAQQAHRRINLSDKH